MRGITKLFWALAAASWLVSMASCVEPASESDEIGYAELTTVSLVPTRDVSKSGVVGVGDTTNLYRDVDDGTTPSAADNDATYVRTTSGTEFTSHTTGYSGAPSGTVTQVTVTYRARRATGTGTAQILLYNGSTRLATSPQRTLGAWTTFTETFSGLSITTPNAIRTRIKFHNTALSGTLRYTQIFVTLTYGASTTDGGTATDSGGGGTDSGSGGTDSGSGGTDSGSGGGGLPTDANLKVAFIGDSANGSNFVNVLRLIRSEGAHMVMHQGDFDYAHDPDGFFATVDRELGASYPYFAAVGNHDADQWAGYSRHVLDHLSANGVTPDSPDLSDQKYAATYRGLKMVFVGENGNNAEFATFINTQLTGDNHIWRICAWHKDQRALQIGGKNDEMGWDVYENCRRLGAIVATAHEHSYERTRTLVSMTAQTVDTTCSSPTSLCVSPGRTFAFVSGLGGNSVRDQERCLPTTFPYGCLGEWAFIYASNQGATYGALFITFNVGGDPRHARGYFKDVAGRVVDTFDVMR